jgi:predicted small secreted protein
MKKHVHWALVLVVLAAAGVAGCNTIRGVGQDVKAAGGAVAGTAEQTQERMRRH